MARIAGRAAVLLAWGGLGGALLAGAGSLVAATPLFEWHREVADMPAAALGLGLAAAGAAYVLLLPLIGTSLAHPLPMRRGILWSAIALGAAARLLLLFSEPALEDDYYRYLWEGALTANFVNPYKVTTEEARRAEASTKTGRLAREGEAVILRVNHPGMTSNYLPLAQAAFAAAHLAAPWNLTAWRLLALAFDFSSMALLVVLLRQAGRDPLWSLLYWWNPIVIKEIANSAHMDGLIVVLVLAALLLAARKRHLAALFAMALAIGAKPWPALLLPLLARPLLGRPWPLIAGGLIVAATTTLWLLPVLTGGPHPHDGFLAYARFWRTNSAVFPAVEDVIGAALSRLGRAEEAWIFARGLVGCVLVFLAIHAARRPALGAGDLCARAGVLTLWLVLLSPAQFPWYVMWTIPFMAFRPRWSVAVMTALVPLYYLSFHYLARGNYGFFSHTIVWAMWVPVWLAVAADAFLAGRREKVSKRLSSLSGSTGERCA